MKYSEAILKSWTGPLSDSEEQRAENAVNMIRSAIEGSDELKTMDIEVFTQGSFANNTNVRAESDVDVCVMLKDIFHCDLPDGRSIEDYGFTSAKLSFFDYRDMVKRALQKKFREEYVEDGNKSLKIHENTYHVNADVVPAIQLRNYCYGKGTKRSSYVEGTWLMSKNYQEVKNYPKIHIENGRDKNSATNFKYKKLVRIMKHIKNNMVDDYATNGDKITSFLVECLVWNVPNEIITGYSTWTVTLREVIRYLDHEIGAGGHTEWGEVSDILYLFHNGRKWTDQDAKQWLVDAFNYLGYSDEKSW